MRKNFFLLILLGILLVGPILSPGAIAAPAAPADWAWLQEQVAKGTSPIALPNDIVYTEGEGLKADGVVRIEGNGFTLTDARVDGGTIVFIDVRLLGTAGINDEDGGHGLTLSGDGAVAVLMGTSRAEGGRSGPEGAQGGDGVRMEGMGQGLILNNSSDAAGGIGRAYGGMGVRVLQCNASILATDDASLLGASGIAGGGSGLYAPSCCEVAFSLQSSATGAAAPYAGGHGIHSFTCETCGTHKPLSLDGIIMAIGSAGQDAGHGIYLTRTEKDGETDLTIAGSAMLLGGDGATSGSGLYASNAIIESSGEITAIAGQYFETEMPAVQLEESELLGEIPNAIAGQKTDKNPAGGISSMVSAALSQQSSRYVPPTVENPLAGRELETKLEGITVERGGVSQAKVSGNGLKIFMHNGTLEKRMKFQQRLMADGGGGIRLVLIATQFDEWPTLEATAAALRKLESLGITQIAYACVEPVYHERVLDIPSLLKAIDASKKEVTKFLSGTADDAIIFVYEDGSREYQEELMAEVVRPVD